MNSYFNGNYEIEYFECGCFDQDHLLSFHLCKDDGEIYCNVNLSDFGFWKRVWLGIKYILGVDEKYGHYGSWTISWEDTKRLVELAQKAEKLQAEWIKGE